MTDVVSLARKSPYKAAGIIAGGLLLFKLFRARYLAKKEHSPLYAIACVGPLTWLRALPYGMAILWASRKSKRANEVEELASWHSRPDDVVIAVPGKSGTTWLMQIAHQLRMKGAWTQDVNSKEYFEDEMQVMPWIEGGPATELDFRDVNMEHIAQPRVFKSHLPYSALNKSGIRPKQVYCYRDVSDVLVSAFKFLMPMMQSNIPMSSFVALFASMGHVDKQFKNLIDYWKHRHDSNVCFFFYDDLKEDHHGSVVRMKSFMGIEGGDDLVATVVEQSTHKFMSAEGNHTKFDDHLIVEANDRANSVVRSQKLVGKVNKSGGKSGSGKAELSPAVKRWVQWRWDCLVVPELGFKSLKEMRDAWAHEQKYYHSN